MYACDLHTHTNRSDGHLFPVESIDRAFALGLKVLAITDHDTILPQQQEWMGEILCLEEYAKEKGITLLRGIEISCDTDNDDVHMIGLYCNWEDPKFAVLERQVQKSRAEGYQELVKALNQAGYDMTWEEIILASKKEENPLSLQKKHIYEYMAKKGYIKTWQDGKKLVRSVPEFQIKRKKPDPVETIEMLHETGGIAIMAHPYLVRENPVYKGRSMTRQEYMDMLAEAGLDGMEACYTYDKTSYAGCFTKEEIERQIRKRYENTRLFFSGGSDFHGDFKIGMKNFRELGECGVSLEYFQKYIERSQKEGARI